MQRHLQVDIGRFFRVEIRLDTESGLSNPTGIHTRGLRTGPQNEITEAVHGDNLQGLVIPLSTRSPLLQVSHHVSASSPVALYRYSSARPTCTPLS